MYFWTIFQKSKFSSVLFFTIITVFGMVTSVQSELRLCNKTDAEVEVAIGYQSQKSDGLNTEGWWSIVQNACEVLIPSDLVFERYYLYAVDAENGGEWGGKNYMCTMERKFTIEGNSNCFVRGFERTGFFEVNTENQQSWTVHLTEHSQQGTN